MEKLRRYVLVIGLLFAGMIYAEGKININSADVEALSAGLQGVGPHKAQAIVDYRKEHGPFKSLDDLANVKGIGDKLVELNKDTIALDGE